MVNQTCPSLYMCQEYSSSRSCDKCAYKYLDFKTSTMEDVQEIVDKWYETQSKED